jgi:hypothetical protein
VAGSGLKVARTDGGTDIIMVRYDPQAGGKPAAASTAQGLTTDALVTVVRLDKDGKVLEMGVIGGTGASFGDKSIKLDSPGIKWLK